MALARSASGPGGLSINTNSANSIFGSSTTASTGGMFGNTQAAKPTTNLFGSVATTSAPQSGGLFGSTTPAAPQTGGLFGSTAATTSAPQSGGLFGSTAATSTPQTGGLFGNTATNTSQPASTGGGLFGSTTATTSQPQTGGLFGTTANTSTQPQGQTGGLFGGLGTNTNQTAGASSSTGGLFGNTAATAQPAQNGGGLFGGLNQTQNKAATPSLFGATQNQQSQAQPTSLFGGLNQTQGQPQASGMFGGSRLGGGLSLGQQSQQAQVVPGVRIDISQVRGTTRFNDLHEDLQKQIMDIDKVIQDQIAMKNQCEAIMPRHGELLEHIPNDVEFCRRKLIGMEDAMETDAAKIAQVHELLRQDADNAQLSFRAIDNLKLPTHYHTPGNWATKSTTNPNGAQSDSQDLVSFFSNTASELDTTLQKYQSNFTEIEAHLRSLEVSTAQQTQDLIARRNGRASAQENPMTELAQALFEFEQSIMGVAGRIGAAREGVQALQLGGFTGPADLRSEKGGRNIY